METPGLVTGLVKSHIAVATLFLVVLPTMMLFSTTVPGTVPGTTTDLGMDVEWVLGSSLFKLYNPEFSDNFLVAKFVVQYSSQQFSFDIGVSARNDRAFADPFMDSYYGGFYFDFDRAIVSFATDNLRIQAGKGNLPDVVDSPYSLFVTSYPLRRNTLMIKYEDDSFVYATRWIELSDLKFGTSELAKKRGANFKLFGTKIGNIRFGYQEVNVYVGRAFDAEYFLNPTPGFFIQYVNDAGRPYPEGLGEANYVLGFFLDYRKDGTYAYAQVLIDDINMNRFLKPNEFQNPDKVAWSFGGSMDTELGKFGVYHAGATKYTFQPSAEGDDLPQNYYGYTLFTDFRYTQQDGRRMVLPFELLYMGYKYGENNLALLFEYEPKKGSVPFVEPRFQLEYVVLGERSPVNPWGEHTGAPTGTHLLDDPVVERRLVLASSVRTTDLEFGSDLLRFAMRLWLSAELGYVWNRSEPVDVTTDNSRKPLLRPKAGNDSVHFSLRIGVGIRALW